LWKAGEIIRQHVGVPLPHDNKDGHMRVAHLVRQGGQPLGSSVELAHVAVG
jgi:hypothetical protein